MTTITLEAIQAEHSRIGDLIAKFQEQANQPAFFDYQGTRHPLQPGEIYVGTITTAGSYGSYHLILLPGETEDLEWQQAMDWAKENGGELPNRVEGALLFATFKDKFAAEAYWTREQSITNSGWAWYQSFTVGSQGGTRKSHALRARAVRRLVIQ